MKFFKENEIIIKKSKFLGFLLQNTNENEILQALRQLQTEHKKATHICYGYILSEPLQEKFFDDGEPSRTAGFAILSVLQKKKLKNVAVFVVRYFGGIKLGAGGLVRAYTQTTSQLFKGEK